MKLLMESWRRYLLTESIDPRIMKQIDKAEEMGCKVYAIDKGDYGFADIVQGEPGSYKFTTIAKVSWTANDGTFGECNHAGWVQASTAHDGLGPLAYDIAMEQLGGLMSDRTEVSDEAEAVWQAYMDSRKDVKQDQLDIHKDYDLPQLTPDNPDDDCDQIPATQKYKGDWSKSALSKVFYKQGTPVMTELERRGMLETKLP